MICYHARHVLPITAPPIAEGTVAVEQGLIAYVGPRPGAPPGEDRDLGDAVLLPGLINAHTHLELTAFRGVLEGLPFVEWLTRLQGLKEAVMSPGAYADAARLGIAEGLRSGTTTFADTCDSGTSLAVMRELGVRGVMYQEVFGPAPEQCAGSLAALRAKVDALRQVETALQRLGVSPHAPYTVSAPLFAAVAELAREERLPIAIHVAESEAETRLVTAGEGELADRLRGRGIAVAIGRVSPVMLLDRLGLLALRPLLIHCVRLDPDDVALIARRGCAVAHCPASNAKLGHGVAPVAEMLRAGVTVALGSDSVASNNRMDVIEEGRVAALLQRARRHDPCLLPAEHVLELATLGGARALGIAARVGSLEPGKEADLAAFDLTDAAAVPVYDAAGALVFGRGGRNAKLVTVAGRELVRDGAPLENDPDLARRVAGVARALAAAAGRRGPDAI